MLVCVTYNHQPHKWFQHGIEEEEGDDDQGATKREKKLKESETA
jgi:hypothetical protein